MQQLLAAGADRRLLAMNGELAEELATDATTKALLAEAAGMKRRRSLSSGNSLMLLDVTAEAEPEPALTLSLRCQAYTTVTHGLPSVTSVTSVTSVMLVTLVTLGRSSLPLHRLHRLRWSRWAGPPFPYIGYIGYIGYVGHVGQVLPSLAEKFYEGCTRGDISEFVTPELRASAQKKLDALKKKTYSRNRRDWNRPIAAP